MMRLRVRRGALVALAICGALTTGTAATATSTRGAATIPRIREWHPPLSRQARAAIRAVQGPSVPMWDHTFKARGVSYPVTMVGSDPFDSTVNHTTHVPTQIIPVAMTFSGSGNVYDPTAPDPQCLNGDSAVTRVKNSPIFASRSYTAGNTRLGRGQFIDMYQRADFWKLTSPKGVSRDYHVKLDYSLLPTLNITVNGPEVNTPCGRMGMMEINTFDYILLQNLQLFSSEGVDSTKFPIFLVYNVVFYDTDPSNCCTLGFHFAIPNPFDNGLQTFAVSGYDSSNHFAPRITDVSILTHEIGEWLDDPTALNPTPPWGHTGQVSGCQANLENGDPLTGTPMTVTMPNGVDYHPQELVFASWFYESKPSLGVNGWYSMNGTFQQPADLCLG